MIQLWEFFMIHQLKSDGLSISEIARQLGLDRKTVRKHLRADRNDPGAATRKPKAGKLDPFKGYLENRLAACPQLSSVRLMREIRVRGYTGGYTILREHVNTIRPAAEQVFEVRFETPPGEQAQVDFACFTVRFNEAPQAARRIWLFSMVLGHSRYLWGRFCEHQKLDTVLRMHVLAFEALGGVPRQLLYDRMKTAVVGERRLGTDGKAVIYNAHLQHLLQHYGAAPRACRPCRPQTKGKVERTYRYVRGDFFLGSSFDNIEHLNECFTRWLDEVANVRCHGTTGQIVKAAFEAERAALTPLPELRCQAPIAIERRVNREGMVAYLNSWYSVPDGTTSRIVEVQALPLEVVIVDAGKVIARHPVAERKGQRVVDPSHRRAHPAPALRDAEADERSGAGSHTARHPLWFYEAVGQRLASS